MNLDQSNPSLHLHSNPIFEASIPIPNMKQQLTRHIAWPKNMNIHRLWLWLPPLNHKSGAVSGKSSTMTIRLVEDSPGESLFSGELSDGGRGGRSTPSSMVHVPKGCLAVYVGPELRRFVIPMSCLSSPDFRVLMERVAEEYGFEQEGGLRIPCDQEAFEHILVRCLGKNKKKNDKKTRVQF